jgi:hypothetical protein
MYFERERKRERDDFLPCVFLKKGEGEGGRERERERDHFLPCVFLKKEEEKERGRERRRRKRRRRRRKGTTLPLETDPSHFGPCDLQDP